MPTSIMKSLCASATFLAAPTAAQIGNWDIIYQSLETDFQSSVTNEIKLDYLVGTGRPFNVDLFHKDCTNPITGMAITTTTARTDGVDHDLLEIMLDLDKSAITSSNIWNGSSLEFCVRVQLLSGGSVIKEELVLSTFSREAAIPTTTRRSSLNQSFFAFFSVSMALTSPSISSLISKLTRA